MRQRQLVRVLAIVLWPALGAAQTPTPSAPTPVAVPEATASPGPTPAPTPEEECSPEKGDTCITTVKPLEREEGRMWTRGFADLRVGDIRIQADAMDIADVSKPDGTTGKRLTAEGNIVFLRGEERLAGSRLSMDLDTGRGVIENVIGYVQPGVFIRARKVERLDPKTLKIEGGTFTSCCQPNPRWSFSARSATLKVGERIQAWWPRFNVGLPVVEKNAPALFLPYFVYPIQEDQRATGLLFPSFNIDTKRGVDVRAGFFWAMGRSADQTFSAEYRPGLSPRLGHEFRYVRDSPSGGTFASYFFPPRKSAETVAGLPPPNAKWEYDLQWNATQVLPFRFLAKVNVNQNSPQNIQGGIARVFNTRRESSLNVQRSFGPNAFLAQAQSTEYFFGARTNITRHLPQLRLSSPPRRLGRTGLLAEYNVRAENVESGFRDGETDRIDRFTRVDAAPALSRPLSTSFLTLTPRVSAHYTRYGASYLLNPDDSQRTDDGLLGGPLTRRYFEAVTEMRGPLFSRVFTNTTGIYSEKFKHIIGSEVVWTYVTRLPDTARAPSLGRGDVPASHKLRYGLVQSFLAKRKGPSGKLLTHEFLTARVFRTYYIDPPPKLHGGLLAPAFDRDYQTPLRRPGGGDVYHSPIWSQIRFRPVRELDVGMTHEYDVGFKQTTRLNLYGNLGLPRGNLSANWTMARRARQKVENSQITGNTLRGGVGLDLFPGRLSLEGSATYDLVNRSFFERRSVVRLNVQCIGLLVGATQHQFFGKPQTSFEFSIELANLGSIGMGPQGTVLGQGGLHK